ncbi:MAG: VTT domain-containing protein [Candidatus Moranbacteria bacterium]|nr:VTT domain-containing protein [Candidatus Moranbacteria bacterium]
MSMGKNIIKYLPAAAVAALFVGSAFLSQKYTGFFLDILGQDKLVGGTAYVIGVALAVVAAPLTSLPFIPVLVAVWGAFWTAVLSVGGWILGSIIAFWLARKFGTGLVGRVMDIEKIRKTYTDLPEKKLFWLLLFLRMVTPVDVLSYALGLFTGIGWRMYLSTTILGVVPLAFVWAYLGGLPVAFQAFFFSAGAAVGAAYLFWYRKRS